MSFSKLLFIVTKSRAADRSEGAKFLNLQAAKSSQEQRRAAKSSEEQRRAAKSRLQLLNKVSLMLFLLLFVCAIVLTHIYAEQSRFSCGLREGEEDAIHSEHYRKKQYRNLQIMFSIAVILRSTDFRLTPHDGLLSVREKIQIELKNTSQ